MPIPSIPTVADSFAASQPRGSFQPAPGGGGSTPTPTPPPGNWFDNAIVSGLLFGFDVRDISGASTIVVDANGGVTSATDISGNGHDFTSFRGAGTDSKKARLATSAIDSGRVWRCGDSSRKIETRATTLGITADSNRHYFAVISDWNPSHSSSASTTTPNGLRIVGGLGSSYNFSLDRHGGTTLDGSASFFLDVGTSTMNEAQGSAPRPSNFLGFSDTSLSYAIVEVRGVTSTGLMQMWMNGYKFAEIISGATVDGTDSYLTFGASDVNSNGTITDFAMIASADSTSFSEANAATLRAAIMADFGITVTDGSTWPY
jgi:hypothetical protein